MAPASPVKGCCMRYNVKKAKTSAVLFWVRAFCSLLGAEIERVRLLLLRILVNSIRVLLIIIVPLPSPSVIELFACVKVQRADVKAVMHATQCPYFEQLLGSERSIFLSFLLFCCLEWIFCTSLPLKLFFFPGYVDTVSYLQKFWIPSYHVVFNISVFRQTPGKLDGVAWICPGDPCIWKDPCWVPCWAASMCFRTSPSGATRKGEAKISILVKSKHLH